MSEEQKASGLFAIGLVFTYAVILSFGLYWKKKYDIAVQEGLNWQLHAIKTMEDLKKLANEVT